MFLEQRKANRQNTIITTNEQKHPRTSRIHSKPQIWTISHHIQQRLHFKNQKSTIYEHKTRTRRRRVNFTLKILIFLQFYLFFLFRYNIKRGMVQKKPYPHMGTLSSFAPPINKNSHKHEMLSKISNFPLNFGHFQLFFVNFSFF